MNQQILAIEQLLQAYSWFNSMLNEPKMDKDMMKITVNAVIVLWTRRLEQLYMQENLNREEVKTGDDEQVSDSMEKPVDWSNYED